MADPLDRLAWIRDPTLPLPEAPPEYRPEFIGLNPDLFVAEGGVPTSWDSLEGKAAILTALFSPVPNAVNQLNRIGGGGEHGYDLGLTWQDVFLNAGYDEGIAALLGFAGELVEPGPGEIAHLSAGLVGVPVALQRLLAKHLNPNLVGPSGFPLTQFHGWGFGKAAGDPSTARGFEGHGHYGAFESPDPHYANAQYSGRYLVGGGRPRPHESPGVVSGHVVTPENPSVVPGSLFGPAQYLSDEAVASLVPMLDRIDPGLRTIFDAWLAKEGRVSFSEVAKLLADHANFVGGGMSHNLSLTDLQRAAEFDSHVDLRPGWSNTASSIETAIYDPRHINSLAPQAAPSRYIAERLIEWGEDPAEVAAAMRSAPMTPEEAALYQLEALRQVMPEYRPLAERPRGGPYGSTFEGHLSVEEALQRYMERVLVPQLLRVDQNYAPLPMPSRLGPSAEELAYIDSLVANPSLFTPPPPVPRAVPDVRGVGDQIFDLRGIPAADLTEAIIEYRTLHGLPIDPQEVFRLVEQLRGGIGGPP